MNHSFRSLLFSALALVLVSLGCLPVLAQAQDATVAATPAATVATAPDVPSALTELLTKHAWVSTVLAVLGALSVVYNALITWAHQRAAATADLADDQWLASLETKWWFRLLDRIFYWGGYLGARLGGRKL